MKLKYEFEELDEKRAKFLYARLQNTGIAIFIKEDSVHIWGFVEGCGVYLFIKEEIKERFE